MKNLRMKKTPSALKWLAETRARVAGELECAEQVSHHLEADAGVLRSKLETLGRLIATAQQKQDRLRVEVAALDQVVVLYDENITPSLIAPINAWQGNYGKRGALKDFLAETLRDRAPAYMTTKELEILTIAHFSLVFEHRALQARWCHDSFRNTLKVLVTQGAIERGPDQNNRSNQVGKWRWKQEVAPTLRELRESACAGSGREAGRASRPASSHSADGPLPPH